MTEFEKVRAETVKFMRGKYKLNEVKGMFYDVPCVKFRQGNKTVVSVNLYEDKYVFQIIFGKAEREKFEKLRDEFSEEIRNYYDSAHTYHDGKWLFITVNNLEILEEVKKLILIKKNPNRKPFKRDALLYGKCGHRCDLCVHFTGTDDETREMLIPHLNNVYGENSDWSMRCTGCDTVGCQCYKDEYGLCFPIECLNKKGIENCFKCEKYPCQKATVGYDRLEHRDISADDVTWAILPYTPKQYVE